MIFKKSTSSIPMTNTKFHIGQQFGVGLQGSVILDRAMTKAGKIEKYDESNKKASQNLISEAI